MKIKNLLSEYKSIAKEMKAEAKNYNRLSLAVMHSCSDRTFAEYKNSWKKLLSLDEKAYHIMYEYRKFSGSFLYKAMFFLGVMPKQNSFRFVNESRTRFKYENMINLLNIK